MDDSPRLILRVEPNPGENLLGYVLRLTERNRYESPVWILKLAGITKAERIERRIIFDSSVDLEGLAYIARADKVKLDSLKYPRVGTGKSLSDCFLFNSQVSRHMINLTRNKVCGECLRQSGYAHRIWDFVLVTACPLHRRMLLDRCPACQNRISWHRKWLAVCHMCGTDWTKVSGDRLASDDLKVSACAYDLSGAYGHVRRKPRRNPLYNLDLGGLGAALTLIAGQFEGLLDPKGKFILPSKLNGEIHTLYKKAFEVFENWPENFHAFIDWRRQHSKNPSSDEVLKRDFWKFRKALTYPLPEFEFMRTAFDQYMNDSSGAPSIPKAIFSHFDKHRVFGKRYVTVDRKKYASQSTTTQILKLDYVAIKHFMKAGVLKSIKVSSETLQRSLFLIELKSIEEFQNKIGRLIPAEQARRLLGISILRWNDLVKAKWFAPISMPGSGGSNYRRFGCVDIERFLRSIWQVTLTSHADKSLTFMKSWERLAIHGVTIDQLMRNILNRKLRVSLASKGVGLRRLRFDADQVRDYVEAIRKDKAGGDLRIKDAALRIGTSTTTVRYLLSQGFLKARGIVIHHRSSTLITQKSILAFEAKFIVSTNLRANSNCTTGLIQRALKSVGVYPIPLKVRSVLILVYKKSDIAALDLDSVVSEYVKTYGSRSRAESRLKRIKAGLLPLPYLIVDTKTVMDILSVTREDVLELVRLGVLRPYGGKAEALGNQELYFARHTVEKRKNFVSNCAEGFEHLVTCKEAAKIAGKRFMSAFINKYVHTGLLVPTVKATWRHHLGFFSRTDVVSFVKSISRERATLVNSAEAIEILGCSRSKLGRLISSGKVKPANRIESTGHYYFPRPQIETFAKTLERTA